MLFLLPNPPQLPEGITQHNDCSYEELVNLNGNHWRKILTIIAKLCVEENEDWRIVRDQSIWQRAELIFSLEELPLSDQWQVIVGKSFAEHLPIPIKATLIESGKHQAFIENRRIWTPYLDYRQFPNALIDALKHEIRKSV